MGMVVGPTNCASQSTCCFALRDTKHVAPRHGHVAPRCRVHRIARSPPATPSQNRKPMALPLAQRLMALQPHTDRRRRPLCKTSNLATRKKPVPLNCVVLDQLPSAKYDRREIMPSPYTERMRGPIPRT